MSSIDTPTHEYGPYTQVLSYHVDESLKKFKYDGYLEPLFWFIKRFTGKNSPVKMKDIAKKIRITPGGFSKIVNGDNSQHRSISEEQINQICEALGFPLSSILFFYERKEVFEKVTKKSDFIKLTQLLVSDYEEILNSSMFSSSSPKKKTSIIHSNSPNLESVSPVSQVNLNPLLGNWYFYVPSSDSAIIYDHEKGIKKIGEFVSEDPELAELYELYSPDHIYCGTVVIGHINGTYHVTLKYMTNPNTHHVLHYEGTVDCPVDNFSVFGSLKNQNEGDLLYLIMSKPSHESKLKYALASVLMLSRHEDQERHRPCSMRMILSRKHIEYDSPEYKVLISNLMMNDAIIRIDEEGYEMLKANRKAYASPALDFLLERFPTISNFTQLNITVNKCAYIEEGFIDTLLNEYESCELDKKEHEKRKNLTPKDMLYLEALLRRHSIAPWYAKTKATKINKNLKTINSMR